MKRNINIIIALVITAIVASCITFGVVKFLDSKIESKGENKNETSTQVDGGDDKILSLSNEKLDEYLNEMNNSTSKTHLEQSIVYQDADKLILNKNLFDNQVVKNKIALYIDNIATEEVIDNENHSTKYYADLTKFNEAYKKVWGTEATSSTHTIENKKVLVYTIGSGMGIPSVNVKSKGIFYENGIYIIKTSVGIINNDATYNYENNYEGQIKFKLVNDNYQVVSFKIVEI